MGGFVQEPELYNGTFAALLCNILITPLARNIVSYDFHYLPERCQQRGTNRTAAQMPQYHLVRCPSLKIICRYIFCPWPTQNDEFIFMHLTQNKTKKVRNKTICWTTCVVVIIALVPHCIQPESTTSHNSFIKWQWTHVLACICVWN